MATKRGIAKLYDLAQWRRRRDYQLMEQPLCAFCLRDGRATRAVIADHVEPHRGDRNAFWFGMLQSLCVDCHNTRKRQIECSGVDSGPRFSGAVDEWGWPLDPLHPTWVEERKRAEKAEKAQKTAERHDFGGRNPEIERF